MSEELQITPELYEERQADVSDAYQEYRWLEDGFGKEIEKAKEVGDLWRVIRLFERFREETRKRFDDCVAGYGIFENDGEKYWRGFYSTRSYTELEASPPGTKLPWEIE